LLVKDDNYLNIFLEGIKGLPRMSHTEARMVRQLQYETIYGIYDHTQEEVGIPLIKFHQCENPLIGSRLRERLEKFESLEIPVRFGISWVEFKSMQPSECEEIFRVARLSQDARIKLSNKIMGDDKQG
jgi:hypothetical protein